MRLGKDGGGDSQPRCAECREYLPRLDEKWPHSRGNGWVNIPYMEHMGQEKKKCNKNRAIFFLRKKTLEKVILLKVTFFGFGVYTPNFVLGLNTLKVEFGIAKGIMILVATGILKGGAFKDI